MKLTLPHPPAQTLRVVAAVLTVMLVILLGGVGTNEPQRPTYHHYVAMGDSFTSAPYTPLTDFALGCNRSSNNYPHRLARALHIADLEDRSCSGAQTIDLYDRRQSTSSGQSVAPQFTALSARTDLVTVGIGANNGRLYAKMATACRKMTKVCPLYDRRDELKTIVDGLEPELVYTLEQIKEIAPDARILLISYPRFLPRTGTCRQLPQFRPQDRATFRAMNLRLRYAMRDSAAEAGVEFVDFYEASIGHDVCARHPWVQGRIGNRHRGAALHPLPAGQAALARQIEHTLRTAPPKTDEDSQDVRSDQSNALQPDSSAPRVSP